MAVSFVRIRPVLGSRSLDTSRAFWCDVFGLELAVERPEFLLLRGGEVEVALESNADPVPGHVALQVHGIELLHERCVNLGATVERGLIRHESGRRDFVARDPDGHRIDVSEMATRGGRIGWVDLTVPDATSSRDFWGEVVGFDAEPLDMGGYADFTLVTDGRPVAGVCHQLGVNTGLPPVWMVYFTVDDLDAALARVAPNGGAILERRTRMAVVRDPAGAVAALWRA